MPRQKYMYARKKEKQPVGRLVGAILIITMICIGTLYSYERYSNPDLYGKWQSELTGESIVFGKDGTMILENKKSQSTYEIIAPGKMRYTIEGKVFEMQYHIEGRTLSWGVEGEDLEQFVRK